MGQTLLGLRETFLGCLLLKAELVELGPECRDIDSTAGSELDETRFLVVEASDVLAQPLLRGLLCRDDVVDRFSNQTARAFETRRRDAFRTNGLRDFVLEELDAKRWHRAEPAHLRGAHVVLVHATVAAALAVDEAAGASCRGARATVQHAAEVVEVDAVSVAEPVALIEYALHLQEGFLTDEGLVPTSVQLAFVANHAGVVRVAEHLRQSAARKWSLGSLAARPRRQAVFLCQCTELRDRVVPCGVFLEQPGHQRGSFLVNVDRVDEGAADVSTDVEVAELGPSDAAALRDLVCHLHGDVFARLADLHLVHDVGDGFHGVAHVTVSELLLRRDELDAFAEKFPLDQRSIGEVTEHT